MKKTLMKSSIKSSLSTTKNTSNMKKLLILILVLCTYISYAQITPVKIGATANDGTGDGIRTALSKLNNNDFATDQKGTASGTDTYTVSIAAPAPGYTTGVAALSSYTTGQRFFITFT